MTAPLPRRLEPEWLDSLPATDPRAIRSRADLRRINAWMGHAGIVVERLRAPGAAPMRRLVDLGGGDGAFLLAVGRALEPQHARVAATLVDLRAAVDAETRRG